MDTLAHGMIGALLCSRTGLLGGRRGPVAPDGKRKILDWTFWAAFGFGILPDVASLGIYFVLDWASGNGLGWRGIPPWTFVLYRITHSLIGTAAACSLFYRWRPALLLPLMAWPVHVLCDVPTHAAGRFMTPLLWPFSQWGFDGWNWWQVPGMFQAIWGSIAVGWLAVLVLRWSWKPKERKDLP
jgi:hypothetical protein